MTRNEYNAFVTEYFDLTDRTTLKCMTSINEADQNQVLGNLAAKLYDKIIKRVADIDYGDIPSSRGDITKIPNYDELVESLTIMKDMSTERKQSSESVDTIFVAIENMKRLKSIWQKGFNTETEMVIVFYNTVALSIVSGTSLLMSATIETIKTPEGESIDVELAKIANHKTKEGLIFKNLEKFNKSCKKGEIEKAMSAVLSAQRHVKESGGVVTEDVFGILLLGGAIVGLLGCIIPILHQLTSALYCLRQSVAEFLAGESYLIKLNAEKVNYNRSKTAEQKKKIIKRQMAIASMFKKWSDALMIKANKAEKEAQTMIKKDNETKYKIDDVTDSMPDSASIF